MCAWSELTHFAGFDWAKDNHDVEVVHRSGRIVADFTPLDVVRLVAALTQLWCMTGAARDAAEHAARRATIMRAVGRLLRV